MILSPRASGTVNMPPSITVPVGAVVMDCTWQTLQPTRLKSSWPFKAAGGRGKHCVSRWNHSAAYELSKVVDVSQSEIIWLIFHAGRSVEDGSNIRRAQPVSDSHLIEVGIANKREQTTVLVFPAESSYTGLSRSLENWGLYNFPMNSPFAQLRLFLGNCDQRLVVDGFHKSIPQGVEGSA